MLLEFYKFPWHLPDIILNTKDCYWADGDQSESNTSDNKKSHSPQNSIQALIQKVTRSRLVRVKAATRLRCQTPSNHSAVTTPTVSPTTNPNSKGETFLSTGSISLWLISKSSFYFQGETYKADQGDFRKLILDIFKPRKLHCHKSYKILLSHLVEAAMSVAWRCLQQ